MKPPQTFARAATRRRLLWIIPLVVLIAAVVTHGVRDRAIAAQVLRADPEGILGDPTLRDAAIAAGQPVYAQHCASCHGAAGKGDRTLGVPDLTDSEHLYREGTVAQIEDIARYGIRAGNKHGWNLAVMPAYASKNPDAAEPLPPQTPAQIETLARFIHAFTAGVTDPAAQQRGRDAYNKAAGIATDAIWAATARSARPRSPTTSGSMAARSLTSAGRSVAAARA
jgi:cytochrome c oxidase cbb3-type subunit 3